MNNLSESQAECERVATILAKHIKDNWLHVTWQVPHPYQGELFLKKIEKENVYGKDVIANYKADDLNSSFHEEQNQPYYLLTLRPGKSGVDFPRRDYDYLIRRMREYAHANIIADLSSLPDGYVGKSF